MIKTNQMTSVYNGKKLHENDHSTSDPSVFRELAKWGE